MRCDRDSETLGKIVGAAAAIQRFLLDWPSAVLWPAAAGDHRRGQLVARQHT
jgi:hypothetical protein